MPKTATTQQIQKQYRTLFNHVIEAQEPLVILNKNKPEVVIIDFKTFEILLENKEKYEQEIAQKALEIYAKEKRTGKLKQLSSLADLSNAN